MKDSDRYFTSDEILALVAAQWPDGIDLDPCWDPECIVTAKTVYDIRRGEDGLILPWHGRVFCNPPYSRPESWLHRAVLHASTGGEVLALVVAAVGSSYWHRLVWPWASVCALSPRPKFTRPASMGPKRSAALQDHAVVYYGPDHQRFQEVWAPRGELITSKRLVRTWPENPDRSVATERSIDPPGTPLTEISHAPARTRDPAPPAAAPLRLLDGPRRPRRG